MTAANASPTYFTDANEFMERPWSFNTNAPLKPEEDRKESGETPAFSFITSDEHEWKQEKSCNNPPTVPIPGTLLLFSSGVFGLFGLVRKR
ncbi:MAG: hypothetical protein ACYC75_03735 [Minisyncoccota bacterium]